MRTRRTPPRNRRAAIHRIWTKVMLSVPTRNSSRCRPWCPTARAVRFPVSNRTTFASLKTVSRKRLLTSAPPKRLSRSRSCSTPPDRHATTSHSFATTAETPFEIALLLDTSGSTRDDVALIRDAALSFIGALRPGDRVGIIAFNTAQNGNDSIATVDVLSSLTNDREQLRQAVEHLGSSNGTPYYDALQKVVDSVFHDPPNDDVRGRRAVVALTDGVDSASNSDFGTARLKLSQAGVAWYFVQINTEDFVEDRLMKDCQDDGQLSLSQKQIERYRRLITPPPKAEDFNSFCSMGPFERMSISRELYNIARREMNDLARVSGGRSFQAATLADARAAFARVAADIGTLYSIGYYPTNKARDGKFRSIKVELKGVQAKAQIRARDGYYAPKQ